MPESTHVSVEQALLVACCQAALKGAPAGDVHACMSAVEHFAESRSMWLKITAWEKAVVVHEVARLSRPRFVLELGAYVGLACCAELHIIPSASLQDVCVLQEMQDRPSDDQHRSCTFSLLSAVRVSLANVRLVKMQPLC